MITIRQEQPADHKIVETITRDAFWNLYEPGAEEHYLVHTLRTDAAFIPELALVIEQDGAIVGSIFYSHSAIITPAGNIPTITFGPLSIAPHLHRQGLGRALLSHSMQLATALGYKAIITQGYRHHYACHGFVGAKQYGIGMQDGNFYYGLLAKELVAGALANAAGYVQMSGAYEADAAAVAAFDASFSPKEKAYQASQATFAAAVTQLDTEEY